MTERTYRLVIGGLLLAGLYFDLETGIYALITLMVAEGLTDWRVPGIVTAIRRRVFHGPSSQADTEAACCEDFNHRFNFDAERALRFIVALFLVGSYVLFNDMLWFIPWLVAFALAVAGLSGICPMLFVLKKVGFR